MPLAELTNLQYRFHRYLNETQAHYQELSGVSRTSREAWDVLIAAEALHAHPENRTAAGALLLTLLDFAARNDFSLIDEALKEFDTMRGEYPAPVK